MAFRQFRPLGLFCQCPNRACVGMPQFTPMRSACWDDRDRPKPAASSSPLLTLIRKPNSANQLDIAWILPNRIKIRVYADL